MQTLKKEEKIQSAIKFMLGYELDLYVLSLFNIVRQDWYNLHYIKDKMHTRENLLVTIVEKKIETTNVLS